MAVAVHRGGKYLLLHTGQGVGIAMLIVLLPQAKRSLVLVTIGDSGFNGLKKMLRAWGVPK